MRPVEFSRVVWKQIDHSRLVESSQYAVSSDSSPEVIRVVQGRSHHGHVVCDVVVACQDCCEYYLVGQILSKQFLQEADAVKASGSWEEEQWR